MAPRMRLAGTKAGARTGRRVVTRAGGLRRFVAGGRPVSLGLLVLLIWIGVHFSSSAYTLHSVDVEGNQNVSPADVEQAAGVDGWNVFLVNPETVARRVVSLPRVARARVDLSMSGVMTVHVQERQPESVWLVGELRFLVDGEGYVVGDATGSEQLLQVKTSGIDPVDVGGRIDPQIVELLTALEERLPKEAGTELAGAEYSSATGVTVVASDGKRICFGMGDRLDEKISVLRALTESGAKWTYLDLRPERRPYYRE